MWRACWLAFVAAQALNQVQRPGFFDDKLFQRALVLQMYAREDQAHLARRNFLHIVNCVDSADDGLRVVRLQWLAPATATDSQALSQGQSGQGRFHTIEEEGGGSMLNT